MCPRQTSVKPVLRTAFIVRLEPVAMRGRWTIGKRRLLPNTELCRSRRSANDGSVADRAQLVSFSHLVCNGQ
jgi:hypothetical protein